VLIFLIVTAVGLAIAGAWLAMQAQRRVKERLAPSRDVPGVRSTLVFERLPGTLLEDGESVPDPELLDAIAAGLEAAGAEPGSWRADREGTVELSGLMLGDAFLLTLGAVTTLRWQLHVYAQPLGGARYAAPPRTESMKGVMRAIDRAVRHLPDVHVIGWQRRQDAFHGDDAFAETPVD
jgi:hypothetical protein